MIILEENFKWHLEAFASEHFIYLKSYVCSSNIYILFQLYVKNVI